MDLEDLATESYTHDSEDYNHTAYSLRNCSAIYDLLLDEWPPCSWWESEAEVSSDPCIIDEISCNLTSAVRGVTSSTVTHTLYADSWESSSFRIWQIALIGIFAGCVSLVTILGNLIVLLSFILHRNIRQTSNYFIASLAVSDLLIGTISMPLYTVYFLSGKNWPLGETPCDLWLALDYTVCLCSIYTVFCITVDRFCSVTVPARYQTWRTERKVILVLFLVWFVPTLVFFTSIIGWQYFVRRRTVPHGKCYVQYMENALFNCVLQVGYFWVTLTAMCVLYAGIYRVALRLNHRARTRRKRMESLVSIAGETITKIGISVSKSPIKGKDADGVGDEEREVERCDGGMEKRPEIGDGEEGSGGDKVCDEGGGRGEHEGNGKEFPAITDSQELQEGDRDPETFLSPGDQNYNLASPHPDEFWEEAEATVSGFNRKRCTRRNPTHRGRTGDRKVNGEDKVRVQRSSNRCLVRKAFDNITRAVSSTRTRKLPLVFYDAAPGPPSSSDEGCTENCDKECHDRQNTHRGGQDAGSVQLKTEVERSIEPGCTLKRNSDGKERNAWNESTLRSLRADSEPPNHRAPRRKSKVPGSNDSSGGSKRSGRARTFSDRILMRGVASMAEQKRRTTHLRTKRAKYVARKSLRTITLILGAFVLCWTPWHVLSLIMGFCPGYMPACVPPDLYDVSYWLCYLNSCINPFCYALANQQFKKAFLRILRFDWRRT